MVRRRIICIPEILFSQHIGNIKRGLRRSFEAIAAEHEITATQFQVLRRLWSGDGINAQTLAREAQLDAATMTGVLDRLESKGLLRREKDRIDRRAVSIVLTAAGRDLETPLLQARLKNNEIALVGLSKIEREQLLGLLERVERNLRSAEKGAGNGVG
jgi:DNA-binding MarR family transcriptional regulator